MYKCRKSFAAIIYSWDAHVQSESTWCCNIFMGCTCADMCILSRGRCEMMDRVGTFCLQPDQQWPHTPNKLFPSSKAESFTSGNLFQKECVYMGKPISFFHISVHSPELSLKISNCTTRISRKVECNRKYMYKTAMQEYYCNPHNTL